jgi:hypothetical protein
MFYVYVYYHPETNMPFYIGKGTGTRYMKHLSETKENTENYKKWAVIQGLRNKGLEPIIKKVFETDNVLALVRVNVPVLLVTVNPLILVAVATPSVFAIFAVSEPGASVHGRAHHP